MSTSTTTTCKARRVSDQMSCSRCGYVWDANDPDPPTCKTEAEIADKQLEAVAQRLKDRRLGIDRRQQAIAKIKEKLK